MGVVRLCVHLGEDGVEDGAVLKVVRVVGLELIGEALKGSLKSLLGGGVDHLGLLVHVSSCREEKEEPKKHTWTPASSGDQAMRMILLLHYIVNNRGSLVGVALG